MPTLYRSFARTRIIYRASAHAPSHRRLVYVNDSGEIDLDGNSWGSAIWKGGYKECHYGRRGSILTYEAARIGQQVGIELSENAVLHGLLSE